MSKESKKLKEPIQRRRSSPDCDTASSTPKSSMKGVKKSASFVASDSRQPLHEEIKFTNDHDDLCSGMLPTGGAKKSDSLHSSINLTPEESINSAIRSILQPLKSPHVIMSLDQINNTVSYIYETVDAAVNDVLATVTVQQKDTGLKVKADYTVKFIDEENLSAVSSQCSLSLPPTPHIAIGIKRSESVETNKSSAPHSATSQHSSISPYPGSSNTDKGPGSKDDLESHSASIPSQKSIQPLEGSSTITDNISTNDIKVNYICLYHAHIHFICMHLYS